MDRRCTECLEVCGDCLRVAPRKPDQYPATDFFAHANKDNQGLTACSYTDHAEWRKAVKGADQ